jgi:hypothetical protein
VDDGKLIDGRLIYGGGGVGGDGGQTEDKGAHGRALLEIQDNRVIWAGGRAEVGASVRKWD